MSMNTKERVLNVIHEHTNVSVSVDDSFDDLGVDYLDEVEILISLEIEFDIELPDEEYFEVKTVKELIALITATMIT